MGLRKTDQCNKCQRIRCIRRQIKLNISRHINENRDANAWLVPCRSFTSNTSFRSIARQITSNQLTTNIRIHIFARHISTLDRSATRYKWIRIHAQSANFMHYLLTNMENIKQKCICCSVSIAIGQTLNHTSNLKQRLSRRT